MNGEHGVSNSEAYLELPTFFTADGEELFGMVTLPRDTAADTGVVVVAGAGTPVTTGRNRIHVRICRELAVRGVAALRFDFHGTGESTGSSDHWDLAHPFVDDLAAAVACLRGHGIRRIALLGSCFGARAALALAAAVGDIAEVILFSVPMRDLSDRGEEFAERTSVHAGIGRYLPGAVRRGNVRSLFDRRHRQLYRTYAMVKLRSVGARLGVRGSRDRASWMQAVGPSFRDALREVAGRSIPVLFVFGTDDLHYREFLAAYEHNLAEIIERAGSTIRIVTIPGRLHGFTDVAVQEASIDLVRTWAETLGSEPLAPNGDAVVGGVPD